MSTFGSFRTVSEIAASGSFRVYSALASGASGQPTHAVKVYSTVDDLADPEMIERGAQAFARAVAVQRTCAQKFAQGYMPVHDTGKTPTSVYYVTDLAPTTADNVIKGQRDLTSDELIAVIRSAVDALRVATEVTRFGHGNIKPNNIMFMSEDLGSSLRLMDPADPKLLSESTANDDMRALGALLFELVEHREAPVGTEIRSDESWQRMADRGEGLRALCEELLNPTRGQELRLDQLGSRLDAVAAMREARAGKKGLLIGGGVLMLAAAGVIGYVMLRPAPPPPPPPVEYKWVQGSEEFNQSKVQTDAAKAYILSKQDTLPQEMRTQLESLVNASNARFDELAKKVQGAAPQSQAEVDALTTDVEAAKQELAKITPGVDNAVMRADLLKLLPGSKESLQSVTAQFERLKTQLSEVAPDKREQAQKDATAIEDKWKAANEQLLGLEKQLSTNITEAIDRNKTTEEISRLAGVADTVRADMRAWRTANSEKGKAVSDAFAKLVDRVNAADRDEASGLRTGLLRSLGNSVDDGEVPDTATLDRFEKSLGLVTAAVGQTRNEAKITLPSGGGDNALAQRVVSLGAGRALTQAFADGSLTSSKLKAPLLERGELPGDAAKVLEDAKNKVSSLVAAMTAISQDAVSLETLLSQGRSYDENAPNDKDSIQSLQTRIRDSEVRRELMSWADPDAKSFAESFDQYTARAQAVADMRTASTAAIAEVFAQESRLQNTPGKRNLARVTAGLARLPAAGFPANAAELDSFIQKRATLEEMFASVSNERKQVFSARLNTLLQDGWAKVVNEQPLTFDELRTALDGGRTMGLTDEQIDQKLSSRVKLNRRIDALAKELNSTNSSGNPQSDNSRVGQILSSFFADAQTLGEARSNPVSPKFKDYVTRLGNASEGKGFLNLREEGPAKLGAGWSIADIDDVNNTYVSYVLTTRVGRQGANERKSVFDFVRVRESPAENKYSYLMTTELTSMQMREVLRDMKQIGAEKELPMFKVWQSAGTPFSGVRAWRGDAKTTFTALPSETELSGPFKGWFHSDWVGQVGNVTPSFYASGLQVNPPNESTPLAAVSVAAAVYFASLMNCRLPTEADMQSAFAVAGSEPADSNRRDQSWAQQFSHIEGQTQLVGDNKRKLSPSWGIFAVSESPDDGQPAVARTDSTLFFADADKSTSPQRINGRPVHHLYGNVSEWVLDRETTPADIIKGDRSAAPADSARAFVSGNVNGVGVIGASAFSPASIEPTKVYRAQSSSLMLRPIGHADVGFRLAFTTAAGGGAGSGTPFEQAAKIVSDLGPIPPSK